MKKILSFLALILLSQIFLNCVGTKKVNVQPASEVRNPTVITDQKICIQPPAQFYKTDVSARIDAKIPYIKETLNAGFSIDQTIQKLREDLPDTYNFETVEYRLCLAVQQDILSKENYRKFLSEVLPKLYKQPDFVRFNVKVKTKEKDKEVALPNALVTVKGTTISTITDSEGNGLLLIPSELVGNATITVSMAGYMSSETKANITKESDQEIQIIIPEID